MIPALPTDSVVTGGGQDAVKTCLADHLITRASIPSMEQDEEFTCGSTA